MLARYLGWKERLHKQHRIDPTEISTFYLEREVSNKHVTRMGIDTYTYDIRLYLSHQLVVDVWVAMHVQCRPTYIKPREIGLRTRRETRSVRVTCSKD